MFICLNCNRLFEVPRYWEEKHGLDTPPYERLSGSPCCHSSYIEAHQCDYCGDWITNNYIKTEDGNRYCENCFYKMELGDE